MQQRSINAPSLYPPFFLSSHLPLFPEVMIAQISDPQTSKAVRPLTSPDKHVMARKPPPDAMVCVVRTSKLPSRSHGRSEGYEESEYHRMNDRG